MHWLIMTQTYEPEWSSEVTECKAAEVEQIAQAYGMERCFKLGFPATKLDTVPFSSLVRRIHDVIAEVEPELIYLVHSGDVHTDHQVTFTAVMSVIKPFRMNQLGVRRVLCYETLSSTEAAPAHLPPTFAPNVFGDITPYIERKIEIMEVYESECQPGPMPRGGSAIRALARYRGATIGVEYAEAFMLVRELI